METIENVPRSSSMHETTSNYTLFENQCNIASSFVYPQNPLGASKSNFENTENTLSRQPKRQPRASKRVRAQRNSSTTKTQQKKENIATRKKVKSRRRRCKRNRCLRGRPDYEDEVKLAERQHLAWSNVFDKYFPQEDRLMENEDQVMKLCDELISVSVGLEQEVNKLN